MIFQLNMKKLQAMDKDKDNKEATQDQTPPRPDDKQEGEMNNGELGGNMGQKTEEEE